MVWVGVNRISVESPAEAEQVLKAFRHRAKRVDLQPGFLQFEVWKEDEGKEVMVLTRWTRKEDFLAWVESPAFRHAHSHAGESPGSAAGSIYEVAIGPDLPAEPQPGTAPKG
jgi:heme-degrading monooxygenase HmoA